MIGAVLAVLALAVSSCTHSAPLLILGVEHLDTTDESGVLELRAARFGSTSACEDCSIVDFREGQKRSAYFVPRAPSCAITRDGIESTILLDAKLGDNWVVKLTLNAEGLREVEPCVDLVSPAHASSIFWVPTRSHSFRRQAAVPGVEEGLKGVEICERDPFACGMIEADWTLPLSGRDTERARRGTEI